MKSGPVTGTLLENLRHLEESLWRSETRFDDAQMEQRFADDFEEFGRSGRRYQRAEMFFGTANLPDIPARLPLQCFSARWLDHDTILTTYQSEVAYPTGTEYGNRSSIWSKIGEEWQLRFHQGTAIPQKRNGA